MFIRFLRDFRSAATNEEFYEAGQEVDLPDGALIVAEGAAEIVTIDSRRGQVEPSKGKEEPKEPRVSSDEETQDAPARGRPRKAT